MPWLLACAGATMLVLHAGLDLFDVGGAPVDALLADWLRPVVIVASAAITLARARSARYGGAWALLGTGLALHCVGRVYYNLTAADGLGPGFPSPGGLLWLSLYPLAFIALAMLLRRSFANIGSGVWLDGVIGGSVVAALVAALVFDPIFHERVVNGGAILARAAYPIGDLVAVGLVSVAWSIAGRRVSLFWAFLGAAFALLAVGDSTLVVEAARGAWTPGGALDFAYAVGAIFIAAAACAAPGDAARTTDAESARLLLPVGSGLAGLALVVAAVVFGLNPLATVLSVVSLLAVVLRLATTLSRISRQRLDLAVLAATDPLTGLANHRALHERLTEELAHARETGAPFSVVALDIDHFKAFNDTYGHTEGDTALQAVAAELSAQAREGELVGRVGGEEFMFVLPGTTAGQAYALAERCRAALSRLPVQGAGLSCSAGVASYPADDPRGTRLAELADGALYWAKRSGRAMTRRYDPREVVLLSMAEQRAQVQEVLQAEGALTAVFQPIVELATGRVAGYEALTRFLHTEPVRPPDVWFAQARRCGLGGALEAKAIATALAVPGRPPGTFLSLNVSPAALVSKEVAAVLPADLGDIVIELTEGEVFASDGALDATLDRLRARGARIAVDDAGAGYAGLQQLVRLKPEIVKLDRSLISGADHDASKIALLEALASFSNTTGAAVCGEGIETVDELRALARVDTTYAQGYALARPAESWPAVAQAMTAHTSAEVSMGMRVARDGSAGADALLSLGEVSELLARARSREDLDAAAVLIARLMHADEVVVSLVLDGERCVQTLSATGRSPVGERYGYDDYPTTEHVVRAQRLGQLIEGDPAADPAELRLLAEQGFAALLMAPIIFRGVTVGLLEVSRCTPRPWTGREIDQARLVAHSLGAVVQSELGELPWTPSGFERAARRTS